MTATNIIPNSLEERAVELIINSGMNPIEAMKQAINDENALITEMIAQKTDRAKNGMNVLSDRAFLRLTVQSMLK